MCTSLGFIDSDKIEHLLICQSRIFSVGAGFLFGAVAGYAIKKVMKIAAVIVGLFVAGLAYLSYRGWIDIRWTAMENATRSTLTNVTTQAVHIFNDTVSKLQCILRLQLQDYL